MKTIKYLFPICLVTMFTLNTGCKKRKLNRDTTTMQDDAKAQEIFEGMFNVVNRADDSEKDIETGKTATSLYTDTCITTQCLTKCIEIVDAATYHRKITLDFGESCTWFDGRERAGKLHADRIGKWFQEGSTHTITTEEYYVDGYKVDGSRVIKNLGRNSDGNLQFSIDVSGTITTPEGEAIVWNSDRTHTWVEGGNTWILGTYTNDGQIDSLYLNIDGIFDDVWEVTGTADGTNRNGYAFNAEITTPLRIQWCDFFPEITEGIIELTPEGLKTRTVDYGQDACDNKATVKVGNWEKEVSLH